jgi:hypothetical protein
MRDKYTQKEAELVFNEHGLKLLDTFSDINERLHCKDEEGYQYCIAISGMRNTHKKIL